MRRGFAHFASSAVQCAASAAAPTAAVRTLTTAGILSGVQRVLTSKPDNSFDHQSIKRATEEFIAMGFDGAYDNNFSHEEISSHVHGYLCAKAIHRTDSGAPLEFKSEGDKTAFFFCEEKADLTTMTNIEKWFLDRTDLHATHAISVRSFTGTSPNGVRCSLYDCRLSPFVKPGTTGNNIDEICSVTFKQSRTPGAVQRYADILKRMDGAIGPTYNIQTLKKTGNIVINVGFLPDAEMYLDEISTLVASIPGAHIVKKFVESFSNARQVYSVYVRGATEQQLADAITMLGVMPTRAGHVYTSMYHKRQLTAHEVVYGYAVTQFAYYFAAPQAEGNYQALHKSLEKDPVLLKRLKNLRNSMFQELMDESSIPQVVRDNVTLFKALYADFEKGPTAESKAALTARINKELPVEQLPEFNALFKAFLTFNNAVKATNFWKTNRSAVAYRLDPSFLSALDFPRVPFAIYLVVGAYFRGFHVRFHDIARGGVRMMLSKSNAEYKGKRKTLFQENYGLAYTQMLKNKDIPESGSKGTVLVSPRFKHEKYSPETLFLQYVDALCDIMIPGTPGVRNTLPKRELLFLGPDENTAGDFPSHAAKWAKARGFPEWKSLTTGKSSWDGGIPHDVFGMTTTSVREYLLAAYEDLGLQQEKLVKFQTGGPDGDLGSNEILLGKEIQKAMCDISGCLYDPNGLDKAELIRMAKARTQVSSFDPKKLSKGGFFLPTSAGETTLPDGAVFTGSQLLAQFHLTKYADADVFVPCGGRPNSVTIDNVHKFLVNAPGITGQMMFDGNVGNVGPANLKFRIISEGANLFITPDARVALENCGVMLFKDSSANKGGVTSSSFEVYTGLAMADEDHAKLMCCDCLKPTEMYDALVKEIVAKVKENARKEYDAIQRDVASGLLRGHRQALADAYSMKMVEIFEFVSKSNLNQDEALFRYVLTQYTPKTLLKQVPLDLILKRVPRAYLEAIFHKQVAIQYIYTAGANANEFSFFEYMRDLSAKAQLFAASQPKL